MAHEGDASIETFRGVFLRMRRALGTTAFGINEMRLPRDSAGMKHDESETGHEEVSILLAGAGMFKVDDDEVAVEAGDYVRVDAAATRQISSGPDGLLRRRRSAAEGGLRRAVVALTR